MSVDSTTTRAIVFDGPGESLTVRDVEVSEPQADEVLIRTAACGACHSDVHKMQGHANVAPPCIFGHEISGVVERVGSSVAGLSSGDPVLCGFIVPCGRCAPCIAGKDEECEGFRHAMQRDGVRFDGSARYRNPDGTVLRASGVGGLSELVVLPATAVSTIPGDVADRFALSDLAVLGCAGLTAFGAINVAGRVRPDETVAVLAAGGVGLCAIAIAKAAGARPVIAVDIRDDALDLATGFGADATINSATRSEAETIGELASHEPDVIIDTLGTGATLSLAVAASRIGGRIVVSGLAGTETARIDPIRLVRHKLSVHGSYGGHTRAHLPEVLDVVRRGLLDPSKLVTRRYTMDTADAAYTAVANGQVAGRALIEFGDPAGG